MPAPGPCAPLIAHLPTLVWQNGRPKMITVRVETCRREMIEEFGPTPYDDSGTISYDYNHVARRDTAK